MGARPFPPTRSLCRRRGQSAPGSREVFPSRSGGTTAQKKKKKELTVAFVVFCTAVRENGATKKQFPERLHAASSGESDRQAASHFKATDARAPSG